MRQTKKQGRGRKTEGKNPEFFGVHIWDTWDV